MKTDLYENLGSFDRFTRLSLGTMLALSILFVPAHATLIAALAFAASYPLITGLTAMDPIVAAIEKVHFKPISFKRSHTATA